MSKLKHYPTLPEDKISFLQKIAYGLGNLSNNILGAAIGCMGIILNLGLKLDPAKVGIIMAIPRLIDAMTDPVMGYVSDNTTSKYGRRRPYIFIGGISVGICFALMWQFPAGLSNAHYYWFVLIGSIIYYLAYTVYATPYIALGYEMTPDYHERTRLMGYSNWIGQIAWLILPWFYWFMYNEACYRKCSEILGIESNAVAGARGLAIIVGVVVVICSVMPAIFCREHFKIQPKKEEIKKRDFLEGLKANIKEFFIGFNVTIRSKPFRQLCGGTFWVFTGFMLISGLTPYIIIYYIFGGNHEISGKYVGLFGTVSSIATLCIIPIVTWLSNNYGKRNAFIITTLISIFGYILKWFLFNPKYPNLMFLPAPLISFGLGGLFTLMGAMMADVCDLDELETGNRREGMFGSIYWWMVKLGVSLALFLSGYLLNWTGFDIQLGVNQSKDALNLMRFFDIAVPVVTYGIGIIVMLKYTLTEEKAHEIRIELEKRRGKA